MRQIPLKNIILLLIIISFSTFSVFQIFNHTENKFIKQRTDGYSFVVQDRIKSTISPLKKSSDLIVNAFVKDRDTANLLLELKYYQENIPLNRSIIHNELSQTYEYLKKFGIAHLHFIDTDGKSLIRFNEPALYGDFLLNLRYGIKKVMEEKVFVEGFEEGKSFLGYRFIYPLYYEKAFLGVVETSIDLEEIHKRLESSLGGLYYLILNKKKLEETVFEKEKKKYSPSIISEDFLHKNSPLHKIDLKEFAFTKEMFLTLNERIKKRANSQLKTQEGFSILEEVQKRDFLVVFTPIKDLRNENIGYFVSYFIDEEITKMKNLFFERRITISAITAITIIIIFLLVHWQVAIKKQKQFFQNILDSSSNIIVIVDKDHIITNANKQFFNFFDSFKNIKQLKSLHLSIYDFLKDPDGFIGENTQGRGWIEKFANKKGPHKVQLNFKKQEYTYSVVVKRVDDENFSMIFNDITELEKYKNSLEVQVQEAITELKSKNNILIQQSKMASMGEMIGIIAHQWQQPLNSISLITTTMATLGIDNLTDEKLEKNIHRIDDRIDFMSKTIDNFRNFFKPNKQRENFSITKTIQGILEILEGSIQSKGIEVEILGDDIEILSLKNEMEQVFLNIINNAKDALTENRVDSPKITITLDKKQITIEDNAGGIPKEHIDSIFELYYSTKGDKGTGIGLYMTKMIVEGLGGNISVKNSENGARFTILLDS